MEMRSKIVSSVLFFAMAVATPLAFGQEAVSKTARVLGEVTAADGTSLTIKTDAGTSSTVLLDEKTNYLRVPARRTGSEEGRQDRAERRERG